MTDRGSWKNRYLDVLMAQLKKDGHRVQRIFDLRALEEGDVALIFGFTKIIPPSLLRRHQYNIVLHESALPKGRGWSPLAWQILKGAHKLPLTLFEAEPAVDSGPVYRRLHVKLQGHELLDEIRQKVGGCAVSAFLKLIHGFPRSVSKPMPQRGRASYFPKRTQESNCLNPNKSIKSQFNLLRIADPERYPAHVRLQGAWFRIRIDRLK